VYALDHTPSPRWTGTGLSVLEFFDQVLGGERAARAYALVVDLCPRQESNLRPRD
jgi:hypothetical protein